MIRTNTAAALMLAAATLGTVPAGAQDVHFTQFNAAPLTINPAFTGNFDGTFRAAAVYRDQWRSVTVPFKTVSASIDAPLKTDLLGRDGYLAGGLQFYNDRAGDGNLSQNSILGSIAYHKFLGKENNMAVSVGLQGGYMNKSLDLSQLYFGDEFRNGSFNPGTSFEYPGLGNNVDYFTVNVGVNYALSFGDRFGISIGGGANNLNEPDESLQSKRNSEVGLGRRYTGQLGAVIYTTDRFSIRPAVLYQTQRTADELVGGAEFMYTLGDTYVRSYATSVFLGTFYRNNDAALITAGLELKGFRVGVSYDYNTSELNTASNGNGGFEISLRYIKPYVTDFAQYLTYPCARF